MIYCIWAELDVLLTFCKSNSALNHDCNCSSYTLSLQNKAGLLSLFLYYICIQQGEQHTRAYPLLSSQQPIIIIGSELALLKTVYNYPFQPAQLNQRRRADEESNAQSGTAVKKKIE